MGFGQLFEYGVVEYQVVGFGELVEQFLLGCLDEFGGLFGFGEVLVGVVEYGLCWFGEGYVVVVSGQLE